MKRRKLLWSRGYGAGARYSRAGHGGLKDESGNSLTIRENRIFAQAWELGYKTAKRDVRNRKND